ncbi:Regulator of microtubule dynamics protein 1 [Aphelenchoides bicaudatus]|nr:Regulator of microtubule dynamics protein 1 [Aphelenchoides bicaudatus]
MVVNMKEIDNLHESGNYSKCYEILKKTVESEPQNVEALWRFARACHNLSSGYDQKNAKRKELVVEGHKVAVEAYNIDPKTKNFPVVKWVAVLTGGLTEYLGTKQKIEEGYKFKAYLDHGLTLDPTEYSLLHMRGRFKFSVANLSWLERKAASAFFASPPTATIDEALEDFLEVEKLKPVSWIDNLIYVARCYLAKSNKQEAAKYLKQAQTVKAEDESDAEALQEVEKLLKTCK